MDLNVRAAARLLCTSEDHIYELIRDGALPHFFVQDHPRFNRVELLEAATRLRLKVAPDLFEDERRPQNGSRIKLSRLLEAGGIHRDLPGADEAAALGALAAALPLPPDVDRDALVALVSSRKGLTPVGNGLALPHARCPIALGLDRPVLALGFPARPFDGGAADARPIHAMFAIASPSIRIHLDVLSKLATALLDARFHALVDERATDAELIGRLRVLEAQPSDEVSAAP